MILRRRRYVDIGFEGKREVVLVVPRGKVFGFIGRWTRACSGCNGESESGTYHPLRGPGCHECGFTGKRREVIWLPLPIAVQRMLVSELRADAVAGR